METYDQNGSEIQPHIPGHINPWQWPPPPRQRRPFQKSIFRNKKRQCMAGHTHGLRFCQNIKGQLPVLSVGMDQRTDRHRITELANRGDATRKVKGCGPCGTFTCRAWGRWCWPSQSFPESRWRGLRSGCLCLRFGVSVNLEVHSKEKMILREHLLQSDICPKHLMFFSSQMALLRKLWFSFMLQWLSSAEKIYSPQFVTWTHSLTTHGRTGNSTFPRPVLFGVPNVNLPGPG